MKCRYLIVGRALQLINGPFLALRLGKSTVGSRTIACVPIPFAVKKVQGFGLEVATRSCSRVFGTQTSLRSSKIREKAKCGARTWYCIRSFVAPQSAEWDVVGWA